MTRLTDLLRFRLAVVGFFAIYAPVLLLLIVVFVFRFETSSQTLPTTEIVNGVVVRSESVGVGITADAAVPPEVLITALLLAPVAALLAWWLAGRAVRPLDQAIAIQEQLIEETSHELRTPLSILATNADVLLSHPEPTLEVYRAGLERSRTAANRMSATIDSLLVDARGRARTLDRKPTDLADLVRGAADALRPLATSANVTLQVGTGGPIPARIDRLSVERAVSNLISNAIEHGPPGSTVTIEVWQDSVDAWADSSATATVAVTDQGPGIAADDQARVFERYWQAGPADDTNGSGIGLAIVRQIAQAHGGEVTVNSPVDGESGTRFDFTVIV